MARSLILWRHPVQKDWTALTEEGFRLLSVFREAEPDLRPNYLKVYRKKDAVPFSWDLAEFERVLRKGAVNKGNEKLGDLGSRIGFFSSQEDRRCIGYSLYTGNQSPLFVDCLVVNIPETACDSVLFSQTDIGETFRRCIDIFQPFWGCVTEGPSPVDGYMDDETRRPNGVQWLNVWGPDIVREIGTDVIAQACREVPEASWRDGVFRTGQVPPSPETKARLEKILKL